MSFVRNTFGFFKRMVLRSHTPHNQVIKVLPKKRHAMSTFRTYELGGDPFNDRIEFYLTDGSTAGGFGDPVPDGEVRKQIRELTEDESGLLSGLQKSKIDSLRKPGHLDYLHFFSARWLLSTAVVSAYISIDGFSDKAGFTAGSTVCTDTITR